MSDQQSSAASTVMPTGVTEENESAVNVLDVFYMVLHRWPWVLLSVFVCVSLGVLYLLYTPPTYTQSASLMVKDDSKGKSISSEVDFGNLGLFQSNINVNNEVSSLKSPDLMTEVVRRLHLDVNYFAPGRFHKLVVYGDSLPVRVKFVDAPESLVCSFRLNTNSQGQSTMSEFNIAGEDVASKPVTAYFGDTVAVPCGKIVLVPGAAYDLGDIVDLDVVKNSVAATSAAYLKALNVSLENDKGSVINLTFKNTSVKRADDVLAGLISVYNENWIEDKNQIAVSTSNFIDERLKVIESELGNVDQDISSYKSAHLIPDVAQASALYMQQNTANESEILALNNQMQMSRYIRDYLTQMGEDNSRVLPANAGINNPGLKDRLDKYNELVLQRNSLVANSSETNPIVVDLNAQLSALRGAILESVDNNIVALNTQIKNLEGNERKTTSRIAANPTQAKYLLSVERQQKVKEALYLFLLQKREENELSQAFTAYNTRIITQPGGSTLPTSPVSRNILLISFLLGLLIPVGVIYIREVTNTRIRGRKDLENVVMPFLGEIPLVKKDKKADKNEESRIVVQHGNRDVVNEAFRVVRTNMNFMAGKRDDNRGTVFMVTSFNPGSGKSFLSINLAASLAIQGEKILVIDGDLRHGSTSAYVGSPKKGLSDYLIGAADDVNSLMVSEGHGLPKNMKVLPIGTMPPNPAELLQSPRLAALLEEMRKEYTYILVDCPPIQMLADAQIIEPLVDRTIFVVRAGLLQRSMVPEIDKLYHGNKFKNMCLILNATTADGSRYGYNYGYSYGYGYGYGYGYKYGYGEKDRKNKS